MEEFFIYNGQEFSFSDVEQAAAQKELSIDEYVEEFGLERQSREVGEELNQTSNNIDSDINSMSNTVASEVAAQPEYNESSEMAYNEGQVPVFNQSIDRTISNDENLSPDMQLDENADGDMGIPTPKPVNAENQTEVELYNQGLEAYYDATYGDNIISDAMQFITPKAANFISTGAGLLATTFEAVPKSISKSLILAFADEQDYDDEDERERLNQAVDTMWDAGVVPGSAGSLISGYKNVAEGLGEVADDMGELTTKREEGEDYLSLAADGEYLKSADALLEEVSGGAASLLAIMYGGIPAMAALGLNAASDKFEDKFDGLEGKTSKSDINNILLASAESGLVETASNLFTKGLGGITNGILGKFGVDVAKNTAKNVALKIGTGFGTEFLEEGIADTADRAIDRLQLGEKDAMDGWFRGFVKNGIVGGVLGVGVTGGGVYAQNKRQKAQAIKSFSELSKPGKDIVANVVQPRVISKEQLEVEKEIISDKLELSSLKNKPELYKAKERQIAAKEQKLANSRNQVNDQIEQLSDEQFVQLADLQSQRNQLESSLDPKTNTELEVETAKKEIAEIDAAAELVFSAPIYSNIALSEKAQEIYDEKGVDGTNEIMETQEGTVRKVAIDALNKLNNTDRRYEGDVESMISELKYGKGGLESLIRTYNPDTNVPLAAYIAEQLPKRANRLRKQVISQEDTVDFNSKEVDDQVNEDDFSENFEVNIGAKVLTNRLGLPTVLIDKANKLVEKGLIKIENLLGNDKNNFTKKDKVREVTKNFNEFFNDNLKNDIKKEFGKNTKTKQDFSDYLNKNYAPLAQAFLSQKAGLMGKGISKEWAINPPTKQEFIDYYEGKDIPSDLKNRSQPISDRKAALAEAVSSQIAEDARNEYLDANPQIRKDFKEQYDIQLRNRTNESVNKTVNDVIKEVFTATIDEIQMGKDAGGGFKTFIQDGINLVSTKKASQKDIDNNPQWNDEVQEGDNIYFEENIDKLKEQLESTMNAIPKELVNALGVDKVYAWLGQINRGLDPAATTSNSRRDFTKMNMVGTSSPKILIKKDGTAQRIKPGQPGVGFEFYQKGLNNSLPIKELLKKGLISKKLADQFKNLDLENVQLMNKDNNPVGSLMKTISDVAKSEKYNTVAERIKAIYETYPAARIKKVNEANNNLMKFQIELLKEQYEKGTIEKDVLAAMLAWQTNIKDGFRGLTALNSVFLKDYPTTITKGEHSKPNALTMVEIFNYVTNAGKRTTVDDIVSSHVQDFGNKTDFNIIDKLFGSTTAMSGNLRLLQGLTPSEAASFYNLAKDGQSLLSEELEKSYKENNIPIDVAFKQLMVDIRKVSGDLSLQDKLQSAVIDKYKELAKQAQNSNKPSKSIKKGNKLSAFDFDDTLFKTNSEVIVNKQDGSTYSLTAAEFASHTLGKGEKYDFAQFDQVIKPEALEGLNKLKDRLAKGDDVTILTARNMRAGNAVMKLMKEYIGKDADKIKFIGVGNSKAEAKATYLTRAIKKYGYDSVFFTDDAVNNIDVVKDVLSKIPGLESEVEQAAPNSTLTNSELAEAFIGTIKHSWNGDIQTITDKAAALEYLLNENKSMTPVQARALLGKASGFRSGNTIFIGESNDMLNTAIHESGHIWNPIIKEQAPELWADMVNKVKEEGLWNSTVESIRQNPESYPPDIYTDESFQLEDEVLATLIGTRGEALMNENNLNKKGFKDFIKSFWTNLRNVLGFDPTTKNFQDLTVSEMLDLAVSEIVTGNPLSSFNKLKDANPRRTLISDRSFNTLKGNILPSWKVNQDPEYKALKQLQQDFKNNKNLPKAIKDSYNNVKNLMTFDEWSDFVGKTVKEVKVGNTVEKKALVVAKENVVSNELRRTEQVKLLKEAGIFMEGDQFLPTEILNEKLRAEDDRLIEQGKKQAEGLNKNFRKILNSKTGRLGKPSRWFIPSNAEDITGLLYSFLPGGKEGNIAKKFFKSTILDPYSQGLAASESEILQKSKLYSEVSKDIDVDKKIEGTPYTVGDAIKVYNWTQDGVDIDVSKQEYIDALVDAVETNVDLKSFANIIKDDFPIEYKSTWRNDSFNKSIYENINSKSRTRNLEVFAANVDNIFNKDNLREIENVYGKKFRQALENSLTRMKTGRNRVSTDAQSNSFLKWINRAVATTMFVNTRSAVLQTLSSLNYIGKPNNNIFQATKALFSKGWKKDFNTLWNSDYLLNRRDGAKFDVLADEITEGESTKINKLLKFGFLPTRYADSFAIALGGSAMYSNTKKALMKNGMSEADADKQAMAEWIKATEESQQSSDPSKISEIQASNTGKLIYAFANTPFQYARIGKRKLQDIASGRSAAEGGMNQVRKDLQSVLYYSVGQAMLFNGLQGALFAAAFEDDDDEKLPEVKMSKGTKVQHPKYGFGEILEIKGRGKSRVSLVKFGDTTKKLKMSGTKMKGVHPDKYNKLSQKEIQAVERALTSYSKSLGNPGAVIGALYSMISEGKGQVDKFGRIDNPYKIALEATSISPPLNAKLRDLVAIGNIYKYNYKEIKEDPFKPSIKNPVLEITGNAASFVGLPLDRVIRKAQNLSAIANEEAEAWQKVFLALGWSEWELGVPDLEAEERKEKKASDKAQKAWNRKRASMSNRKTKKKSSGSLNSGGSGGSTLNKVQEYEILGQANKDGSIDIKPGLSKAKRKSVMAHEKAHQKDMKSGKLDYDSKSVTWDGKKYKRTSDEKIVYNGKKYIEGHPKLPWEAAANRVERKATT